MPASRKLKSRLAWFLACLAAGGAAGVAGAWFTGNPYWYLAIPAVLALGWLWVASPDECIPPATRRSGRASDDEGAP
jgi:hypothetical protein